MTPITLLVLVIHLLVMGSIGWAEEPTDRADAEATAPSGESVPLTKEKPDKTAASEAPPVEGLGPATQPGQSPPVEVQPEQTPPSEDAPDDVPIPGPSPDGPPVQVPPTNTPPDEESQEEKAATKALEQPEEEKEKFVSIEVERVGGIIGKGRLVLTLSQTYAHLSSNQLFIEGFGLLPILIVGEVTVQRIRRDIFITSFSVAYKVTDRLQVRSSIPYQYTYVRISEPTGILGRREATFTVDDSFQSQGLGDFGGGFSYKIFGEHLRRPALTIGLGFRLRTGQDIFETEDPALDPPTGSGFNTVSLSTSLVKTSDPAVIFGSVSYSYTMPRKDVVFRQPIGDPILIDFDPGDSIGLSMGLSFALNSKLSMSFQYQQSYNSATRVNRGRLPNSATNAISIRFGLTWRINERRSVNLSVTPGLTPDAADVRVSLVLPWRY